MDNIKEVINFWLLFVGTIGVILGSVIVIILTIRYYKNRHDIKNYWYLFVFILATFAMQIVANVQTLIAYFYPIPEIQSFTVFIRGFVSVGFSAAVIRSYPKLLTIPSRQKMEEDYNLYKAREEITLEGTISTTHGKITEANNKACKIYGYSKEELLNLEVIDLIYPEDRQTVLSNRDQQVEHKYECRGLHKDGSILYLEVRGKNTIYEGKEIRITAIKDLTKERNISKKLLEDTEHLLVKNEIKETTERITNIMQNL